MKKLKQKIYLLLQNISQFGWFIPVSNLIILYGGKYLPTFMIAKLANKKHEKVESYLFKTLDHSLSEINQEESIMEYEEKSPIWYCWFQGVENLPLIPSLCLKSIRKHANGHPVNIITIDNYVDYVTIPDYVVRLFKDGKIKPPAFSDILRVSLLCKYGGVWMDATIFCAKDISEDIFINTYYTIKTPEIGFYVSKCRWTGFFQAAWKNNFFMKTLQNLFFEYVKKNNRFVDYLLLDYFIDILYQRNFTIKKMIDDVPMNNVDLYFLKDVLCEEFDLEKYEEITNKTSFFKLNWRMYSDQELEDNKNNYYNRLLSSI